MESFTELLLESGDGTVVTDDAVFYVAARLYHHILHHHAVGQPHLLLHHGPHAQADTSQGGLVTHRAVHPHLAFCQLSSLAYLGLIRIKMTLSFGLDILLTWG